MRLMSKLGPFVLLVVAGCAAPEELVSRGEVAAAPRIAIVSEEAPELRRFAPIDGGDFVSIERGGRIRLGPDAPLGTLEGVRFVEPLAVYETQETPSDTRFSRQWALRDVRATTAWETARDASDVTVAVVDSGVALEHPDLAATLWVNEGEEPDNGLDDDGNGYVDDVHGWDFVDDDGDPSPERGGSTGHGTHVAGIIGAEWDNGRGVSGIAPRVKVMPLRALAGRRGTSDAVADAVDYAAENGARVINLSLGGTYSRLLDEALARACRRGVIVVAASGNDGGRVVFPASSGLAGVVGVGATDSSGELTDFTNTGSGLDVTAPGADILSTLPPQSYGAMSGTSMAAPHVAGALALALAARPAGTTVSIDGLLALLPRGPSGLPRLDLAALVGHRTPAGAARLSLRRGRIAFTALNAMRRPPPQTLQVDATQPTAFEVRSPDWVHLGRCREAPCRLSFSVDARGLGAGAHSGTVTLRALPNGPSTNLAIELFVGDMADQALVLSVNGAVTSEAAEVRLDARSLVEVRALRAGLGTSAALSLDGQPVLGSRLRGMFRRPGRHRVDAVDPLGNRATVDLDVVAEGTDAPTAVGLP